MKCVALFSLFVCAVLAAPQQEESSLKVLAAGNRQFAAGVYKEILKKNNGNLIFSPFSAETVLALLSEGARGATREELISGLALSPNEETNQKAFKEFLPKLKSDSKILKLLSANKIYANNDVKLEAAFEKIAKDIYESGIESVDFAKNVEAAHTINQWVEAQTNNKIKDLIKPDDVDSDTALVLVNALYLSAKWVHEFNDAEPGKFFKAGKEEIEVPMMSAVEYYRYHNNTDIGVQFLEIPYRGEGLSMVIALPHARDGLTALEQNVEQLLAEQPLKSTRVDLKLPKFTIESEIPMVDILKNLGVKKIFENADLTGLSSTHKNLVVSNVIQKAFINVTETGTEAAAATAVIGVGYSLIQFREQPIKVEVDHPFVYYIKTDNVILFAGTIKNLE